MPYTIEFARRAQKQLAALPVDLRKRIGGHIKNLTENPRPSGCVRLRGFDNTYRIRVGDYRILYEVQDQRLLIYVLRIGHRREIYR